MINCYYCANVINALFVNKILRFVVRWKICFKNRRDVNWKIWWIARRKIKKRMIRKKKIEILCFNFLKFKCWFSYFAKKLKFVIMFEFIFFFFTIDVFWIENNDTILIARVNLNANFDNCWFNWLHSWNLSTKFFE